MHGLAHLSGFFAAWTKAEVGYPARPALFSKKVTLKSPLGKVFGLLWPAAALALAAGGFGLAFGHGWWPGAALLGRGHVPVRDPALAALRPAGGVVRGGLRCGDTPSSGPALERAGPALAFIAIKQFKLC